MTFRRKIFVGLSALVAVTTVFVVQMGSADAATYDANASVSCAEKSHDFAMGSSGHCVVVLQDALNRIMGNHLNEKGYFGSATRSDVLAFQQHIHSLHQRRGSADFPIDLERDGRAGPRTFSALASCQSLKRLSC